MCGICGIAFRNLRPAGAAGSLLSGAVSALAHRGPNASGLLERQGVSMGHTRLSILDLSDAGHQPMESPDGRFAVTYNGECYNYRDIASDLALEGIRSTSDTEVVLRAFAQEGPACLRRLNGMFAFAIHARVTGDLWLVRDRLGIKPLYYYIDEGRLCFASEVRALLHLIGRIPRCDPALLHEWLYYGNSLGGKSLFRGVQQLAPGHFAHLRLSDWKLESRPYWSLAEQCRCSAPIECGSDLAAAVRDRLAAAVQRQLVSDVPIGIFLSGGVDSSAIAAFASRASSTPVRTFCAGFDDPSFPDERPRARMLAARLGTEHQEFMIRGDGLESIVEELVEHHGAPFFDAANIPLWLMARAVAPHVKVMLQGDGGDEVFGGYRRYRSLHYRGLLTAASFALGPVLRTLPRSPLVQRARRYANAFGRIDITETMALLLTEEGSDAALLNGLGPAVRKAVVDAEPLAHHIGVATEFRGLDVCRRMSMVDLSIVLPDIYLEKVDRSTMAHGVEVRVPFLDHDLVDFMVRVPGRLTMPGGRTKWLLKSALSGVLPDEILKAPKTGFNVPFGRWLRGPLRRHFEEHLNEFARSCPEVIDLAVVRNWIGLDASGQVDLSSRLWKIYNLAIWGNRYQVRFEP
ncbi:MAG: asparagine synthase (glutamine-hydrolyzing) [Phycisphaerales bacterium]